MIKAIFFDFGGVLTETCWDLVIISAAIRKALIEKGIVLTPEFDEIFIERMKEKWRSVLRTMREERLIDILSDLLDELSIRYSDDALDLAIDYVMEAPFCIVRKEARSVLAFLKEKGLKIGIISNSPIAFHRRVLMKHDLLGYFDDIIVSCEVGYRKPDTRIFTIALDRMNVSASESIYVGDVPCIDVPGAKKLGMITVLMRDSDPAISLEEIESDLYEGEECVADYVIDKLEDIITLISKIIEQ